MRSEATQRLKLHNKLAMARTSRRKANMDDSTNKELPKFRYLDDAVRYLDCIGEELSELKQVVKVQHRQLAKAVNDLPKVKAYLAKAAIADFSDTKKRVPDPTPSKGEVPSLSKLKHQYALSEDLYSKFRALQMVESQITMQFADKGRAFKDALIKISLLKGEVSKLLAECLKFITDVANSHVPKIFSQYLQAVIGEIERCVPFERIEHFLYINVTDDGRIVFTSYIMLINAVNGEGNVSPHLYISVQWVVGSPVQIQLNHEFESPERLLQGDGLTASSISEAVQTIGHQLEVEGFPTPLGGTPVVLSALKKKLKEVDLQL